MNQLLYVTSDDTNAKSGGGIVTKNESEAMKALGQVVVLDKRNPAPFAGDDDLSQLKFPSPNPDSRRLAHFYSGTWSDTVRSFKQQGFKISYTAAAHSIEESRKEHQLYGIDYDGHYPHITKPELWERYVRGYLEADLLIVPSTHSQETMVSFGADRNKIKVIPHGCHLPEKVDPLPKEKFYVGYLGAYGPDKGVVYLIKAWRQLNLLDSDAVLILAGKDSQSKFVKELVRKVYGGEENCYEMGHTWGTQDNQFIMTKDNKAKVFFLGWVDKVEYFYNPIDLYVQPSVTEGFGIEVLEAMSYGRPVICSEGAGACDLVPANYRFPRRDVDYLAYQIKDIKDMLKDRVDSAYYSKCWRDLASNYTWNRIREMYQHAWHQLLGA